MRRVARLTNAYPGVRVARAVHPAHEIRKAPRARARVSLVARQCGAGLRRGVALQPARARAKLGPARSARGRTGDRCAHALRARVARGAIHAAATRRACSDGCRACTTLLATGAGKDARAAFALRVAPAGLGHTARSDNRFASFAQLLVAADRHRERSACLHRRDRLGIAGRHDPLCTRSRRSRAELTRPGCAPVGHSAPFTKADFGVPQSLASGLHVRAHLLGVPAVADSGIGLPCG
jgi:hypothetical protein